MSTYQRGNAIADHEAHLVTARRLGELVEQQKLANVFTALRQGWIDRYDDEGVERYVDAALMAILKPAGKSFVEEALGELAPSAQAFVGAMQDTIASQRLAAARQALIATGYFTADQVGDDIAPRIIELHSALTRDAE